MIKASYPVHEECNTNKNGQIGPVVKCDPVTVPVTWNKWNEIDIEKPPEKALLHAGQVLIEGR